MNTELKFSKQLSFFLIAIGIFVVINSTDLLSEGMFMDGLIYSTVSKNMSEGLGTFWSPVFTETLYPEFKEHPPLAFGIQSIFFRLFGVSRFVDKAYSIFTLFIIGILIVAIWKSLKLKYSWLPVFLWLIIPLNFFACSNNILENTLTNFILLSVLFFIKSRTNKPLLFLTLSGMFLSFGFLTKGFVTFFPWTMPFLYWMVFKENKFCKMIFESLIIVASSLIPLILIIIISENAKNLLADYIDIQVINSIKNVTTVESRFYILGRLINEIIPPVVFALIIYLIGYFKKIKIKPQISNLKTSIFLLLTALTGVLPLMITLKQRGFYLVPVIPILSIALGLLIYHLVENYVENINYQGIKFKIFRILSIIILVLGIGLTYYNSDTIGRDKSRIADMKILMPYLQENTHVNIAPEMSAEWNMRAYMFRFKKISLDPNLENMTDFLITEKSFYTDTLMNKYDSIPLETQKLILMKLKK